MGRTSPGCESALCVQYMYSIIDHPTKCVSKENQTRETKTAVLAESVLGTAGDSHPVDLCIRCAPEAVASRRARGAPLLPGAWQRGSHARVRLRAHVPSATPSRRAHRALEPRRAAASMRGGALGGGGARCCRARLGLRPCGVRPAGARSAHGARHALSSPLHRDCVLT